MGRKGCAASPNTHIRAFFETQVGNGSRYTNLKSMMADSGAFLIIAAHFGSQSFTTANTSSVLPGKDQDSSISASS